MKTRREKVIHSAIFLIFCIVSGCSTVPPAPSTTVLLGGVSHATEADKVAVTINARGRYDKFYSASGQTIGAVQCESWPVWEEVFVGRPGDETRFEILSTRFVAGSAYFGFAARTTYTIEGTLHFHGREYPIRAAASSASPMGSMSDSYQAAEMAIIEAAHECRAIIERESAAKASPPAQQTAPTSTS